MVKRTHAMAVLVVAVLMLAWAGIGAAAGFKMISKDDLRSELGKTPAVLLDVRPGMAWMFSGSKIEGAVREDPGKVDEWRAKYPKDKDIILYCYTDVTSSGVARQLASAGYEHISVLRGGWKEWSDAKYPTVKK